MINRCHYPTNGETYKNYGSRGIKVCKQWFNYLNFLGDMWPRPHGKTLDRINNNKGYNKNNCKWSTRKEQQRNRRCTVKLIIEGKEYLAMDLAELAGKKVDTIIKRARQRLPYAQVVDTQKHTFNLGLYGGGGKANGIRQQSRTHCKHGHEYTSKNTRITPQGWRVCRTCHKAKTARQGAAKRAERKAIKKVC